jgi:DNA-binding transcriptional LysR family regulator
MNLVTLRQLEYFLAVAELGSVSAAARRCHVSPGGISLALTELETSLGVQLMLRRKAKGAALTPAGRWVADRARSIVTEAGELQFAAQRLQGELVGPLKIGCFGSLSPWLLPRIIEYFAANHPAVDIELTEGSSDLLQRMLLDGELDVCLMYSLHVNTEVELTTIAPVRLQLLLSPDHPLAAQEEIALRDLGDSPAALLGLQPARDLAENQLRSAGFEPQIKWRSTNVETIRSLVARGLAYSVLMGRPLGDRTYEGLPLAYRRIKDDLPDNAVVAAYPRGMVPSQKVRTLLKYCQDEFSPDRSRVQ